MAVGRNEPCPCGSGRRYKVCHGRTEDFVRKVDFAIAGAQKGGTSALADYLEDHIEVSMGRVKEVHYFDHDENFPDAAVVDYAPYHANFDPRPTQRILGDATPAYMFWHSAPARIARYNPAMKLIMLLRDPAKRAYSQWNMVTKQGRETLSFDDALRAEEQRAQDIAPSQLRAWSYVQRGRYSEQLDRVWQHVPRTQTLVIRSDKLKNDPAPELARVAAFLGIAQFPRTTAREVFALPYEEPMSDSARDFLRNAFAQEIDTLEELLGWDLADWRRS
ncbi:MAG: sulfotransferase domain-containing protein [Casimicrobiaceae bacterium]